MLSSNSLTTILFSRIDEEVVLALNLIELVPPAAAEWRPDWPSLSASPFTVRRLCAHLCDTLSGVVAVLAKLDAVDPSAAQTLRARVEGGRGATIADSQALLSDIRDFIRKSSSTVGDEALGRTLPTVFTPAGKPAMTLLLTNLAHFTNHKYQLFIYLKALGVPVSSQDLYRFDT